MKIDGLDITNISQPKLQGPQSPQVKTDKSSTADADTKGIPEMKGYQHISEYEKKDLPVSEKVIIEAIEKANKAISGGSRRLEFAIHQKTKEIMIKVINTDTHEVVREIPPEKTLDMVAKTLEMIGILVDERR